ncbi:hypothetical protein J7287_004510 [Vibrio parahaemolyticus]|nr:hypothetical protein [Vibrio parahaemolyticus]EHH3737258.1 hypothetical protein [Vibrio parahaemolyticus]EHR1110059.1 hypothetical protein [Vibrio parahaemolyticus]
MTTVALYGDYIMTDNLWSSFADENNPIELPNSSYAKIMCSASYNDIVAVAGDLSLIHNFKRWFYGENVFSSNQELMEHVSKMSIIWYGVDVGGVKYMNQVMPFMIDGHEQSPLITTGSGAPFFISALESGGNDPFTAIIKSKQLDRATGGKTIYIKLSDPSDNNLPSNHADVAACYGDLEEQFMKLNADATKVLASLKAPIGLPTSLNDKKPSEAQANEFLKLVGRTLEPKKA